MRSAGSREIRNRDAHEETRSWFSSASFVVPSRVVYPTHMDDDLDETIEETFPASDAPANTPETGIGVNGDREAPAAPEKPERTEGDAREIKK